MLTVRGATQLLLLEAYMHSPEARAGGTMTDWLSVKKAEWGT